MQLFHPLTKGIHQGIGSLIEQRPQRGFDQGAGIIERQIQADLAGLLTQRLEVHEKTAWMLRSLLED